TDILCVLQNFMAASSHVNEWFAKHKKYFLPGQMMTGQFQSFLSLHIITCYLAYAALRRGFEYGSICLLWDIRRFGDPFADADELMTDFIGVAMWTQKRIYIMYHIKTQSSLITNILASTATPSVTPSVFKYMASSFDFNGMLSILNNDASIISTYYSNLSRYLIFHISNNKLKYPNPFISICNSRLEFKQQRIHLKVRNYHAARNGYGMGISAVYSLVLTTGFIQLPLFVVIAWQKWQAFYFAYCLLLIFCTSALVIHVLAFYLPTQFKAFELKN
ncbi:hypothetical protein ACJX0J_038545, partial [Zea mays]